jgi:hypothetical protein
LSVVERGIVEGLILVYPMGRVRFSGGTFSILEFRCSTDAMTDDVTCYISERVLYLPRKNGYSGL